MPDKPSLHRREKWTVFEPTGARHVVADTRAASDASDPVDEEKFDASAVWHVRAKQFLKSVLEGKK